MGRDNLFDEKEIGELLAVLALAVLGKLWLDVVVALI